VATLPPAAESSSVESFTPRSSFLEKCEYDSSARSLTITFKTGSSFKHLFVYPTTWLSFKTSPDHSSFYANAIRGKFSAIPIVRRDVGKKKSAPLHKVKLKRTLESHGIIAVNSGHNRNAGGNVPVGLGR
jgi:hypothetical protein